MVEVMITTDKFPSETAWGIIKALSSNNDDNDVNDNELIKKEVIVFHGGEYLAQEHTTCTNSKCLRHGNYEFIIYDL